MDDSTVLAPGAVGQYHPPNESYDMVRDVTASMRLNYQHYLWLDSFGFNLHPHILERIKDRKDLAVADVGTGTGIWLHDLSRILPSTAVLEGLDIDLGQCPPAGWTPANVSYRQLDALGTIPQDLMSRYDVINVRNILAQAKDDDARLFLTNILAMLKPGGWLQWSEYDSPRLNLTKVSPETSSEAMEQFTAELGELRRVAELADWAPDLEVHLKKAGLQNTALEERFAPLSHLPYMHLNILSAYREVVDRWVASGRFSEEKTKQAERLLANAVIESKKGVGWNMAKYLAIGRKVVN